MQTRFSRNPLVDFVPLKGEAVLFHSQTNQFCLLNTTAAFVWSLLERPCSVTDLAMALNDHFDGVNLPEAIEDVGRTASELLNLNFVLSSDGSSG